MVQCCAKQKTPALVLKLDFAKAFDSIDWLILRKILLARGFPRTGVIGSMLSSAPPSRQCS
jgi:hypothetical protein